MGGPAVEASTAACMTMAGTLTRAAAKAMRAMEVTWMAEPWAWVWTGVAEWAAWARHFERRCRQSGGRGHPQVCHETELRRWPSLGTSLSGEADMAGSRPTPRSSTQLRRNMVANYS